MGPPPDACCCARECERGCHTALASVCTHLAEPCASCQGLVCCNEEFYSICLGVWFTFMPQLLSILHCSACLTSAYSEPVILRCLHLLPRMNLIPQGKGLCCWVWCIGLRPSGQSAVLGLQLVKGALTPDKPTHCSPDQGVLFAQT